MSTSINYLVLNEDGSVNIDDTKINGFKNYRTRYYQVPDCDNRIIIEFEGQVVTSEKYKEILADATCVNKA